MFIVTSIINSCLNVNKNNVIKSNIHTYLKGFLSYNLPSFGFSFYRLSMKRHDQSW